MTQPSELRLEAAEHSDNSWGLVAGVASSMLTVMSYLLWLGWHEPKHLMPGTFHEVGPHEAWQIIGFVLSLGFTAAVSGWLRHVKPAVWGTSLAVTTVLSIEAATDHQDDASMWQIGAAMVFGASFWGVFLVATAAYGIRRVISSRDNAR